MKYVRILLLVVIAINLSACASTKEKRINDEINAKKLNLKGNISLTTKDQSLSATAIIYTNLGDSVTIDLYGPMSIPVSKFFADSTIMYSADLWNSVLYIGKPNKQNIKKAVQIPLSVSDLLNLIRKLPLIDESKLIKESKSVSSFENDSIKYSSTKDMNTETIDYIIKKESVSLQIIYNFDEMGLYKDLTLKSINDDFTLKFEVKERKKILEKFKTLKKEDYKLYKIINLDEIE